MTNKTKIEWADVTWNPITGCSHSGSPGCDHCYARTMAHRLRGRFGYPEDDPFTLIYHLNKINEPLHWKKPRLIFVCSMGDLFHEDLPNHWIDRVWATMKIAPQHTFMVLTKRPERMLEYYKERKLHPDFFESNNIWFGVTAENQRTADERIPILLQIPAAVRFVSVEPMLEAMNILKYMVSPYARRDYPERMNAIEWVICGAETGPGKRYMDPVWAMYLQKQCANAGIPFFFKKDSDGNHTLGENVYEEYPNE